MKIVKERVTLNDIRRCDQLARRHLNGLLAALERGGVISKAGDTTEITITMLIENNNEAEKEANHE